MASARTSSLRCVADEKTIAATMPAAGKIATHRFGSLADMSDPSNDSFLFTKRKDIIDGFLHPAVDLAFKNNLNIMWDNWTNAALRAVMQTDDLVSKKMMWMTLLVTLPDIQDWFLQNGPPQAEKWLAYVKTEINTYCMGKTYEINTCEDVSKKNKKGPRMAEEILAPPIYASIEDFVCSMTAYYLSL